MSKVLTQTIEVNAPLEPVFKELCLWGESSWWPKNSLMTFINLSGQINSTTVYLQKVNLPFGPKWHSRIEILDRENFLIKKVFIDGMFSGFDKLYIECLGENTYKIIYSFYYDKIHGFINRIMWNVLFEKLHKNNVDKVLSRLKQYLEESNQLSDKAWQESQEEISSASLSV